MLQCFFLDGNQEKNDPQPPTRLHFDLNMIPLQPFDHKLILLAWREPGPDRFPRPAPADAPILRFGNPDETFLRRRIDRMMIDFKAPLKFPDRRFFPGERVQFDASASANCG